jgi:hypothetical protein
MKIPSTIFLLCITIISHAQRVEVTSGPILNAQEIRAQANLPKVKFSVIKPISHSSALFFNTQAKRTYHGFGFSGDRFQFAVFDDYVKFNSIKKLTSETINSKVTLYDFVVLNNKMYMFYTMSFPERDEFSLYVNEVDKDMKMLGSPVILQTYRERKKRGENLAVIVSKNKKHILISRIPATWSMENKKVDCKVISDSFSDEWNKEIELEFVNRDVSLQTMDVDNNGNFYLLTEVSQQTPYLYSYFWKNKSVKTFILGLNEGDNFGTNLELLNGTNPFVVGLNKNKKKVSCFINRIDTQTESLERLGSNVMPENFIEDSKFREFATKHWRVVNLISLANNDLVASIEATLVEFRNGIPIVYYTYNTFVVSFKENGTPNWSTTIHKRQQTGEQLAGHLLVPAQNNALIIYNDHPKNMLKKHDDNETTIFTGVKEGVIVIQEVDEKGKITRYPMVTDKALTNYALNISQTGKIDEGFYFAYAMFRKGMFSMDARNITFKIK